MTMQQALPWFGGFGRLPVIRQTEATECGMACLAMIASYHGHRIDLNTLRRRYPVSMNGVTLRALIEIASHMKLACRAVRFDIAQLKNLRLPAIVHWDMDHFVVLKAASNKKILIHDPALGERHYSLVEASKHLTGIAVEFTRTADFVPKNETARLRLSDLLGNVRELAWPLLQIFMLSLILEILVIASPFYMQLVIDDVIAKGDADLLFVLALGFGMLTVIAVVSTAMQSSILLLVQNTLSLQMAAKIFRHFIRLPLAYFEKRHVGDLLSRFSSMDPIRDMLAQGVVAAVINSIMAVATLVMIFVYSPILAAVVLVALALYAGLRVGLYRVLRYSNESLIQAKAKQTSTLIETVRAVQSIKLFNRENEFEGHWLNRYVDVVSASVRLGRIDITFKALNGALIKVEDIISVFVSAKLVLNGSLTIGMVFAFMSYKRHLVDKAIFLIEKVVEFRLLDLHLARLADIALTPTERGYDCPLAYAKPIEGCIELRNICFRYSGSEPLILDQVNLTVEAGQFVAIAGPSGTGKTTLVKIMLGLLKPTKGDILVDGLPLSTIGLQAYREQVGSVMQDDQLISGSIADNICFFAPAFDRNWMTECAEMAGIHDEIMTMPMTYNRLIGDMGSSLSGGQKQRLLLARALYRRPKILVMDEGTAHLDIALERYINESLRSLNITRIIVAHRPETLNAADRIVAIKKQLAPA
jgi:ATP-binding cassette subfamily B protein RaxB